MCDVVVTKQAELMMFVGLQLFAGVSPLRISRSKRVVRVYACGTAAGSSLIIVNYYLFP